MTDETVFAAALEHADPRERAAYLNEACAADPQQRMRVEALLAAYGRSSGFLEGPAAHPEAEPGPGPTRRGGAAPEEADEPEPLDFLEPPMRPDSLGRLGHYEVLQVVGRGGFGIVFRAFDDVLQRVVAIKVLSPRMAATSPARKRFVREARGYAAVRHENVVAVHAIEAEPLPYIVMEFIPGETLEHLISRTGPVEAADVVRIGIQIARGLAAAHAQGIIHRDIKPANVLVEGGPDRRVKLTDFGLARAADDASLTQSGMIAGTPMYMAPEQAYGIPLDHRADLFSLGSVLYTLCTGRAPFRAQTSIAVLRRVAEADPRPVRDVIPETPQGLCDVIARLHAKKPDDRFQSATEVAERLSTCLTRPADATDLMPAPAKPKPNLPPPPADSGEGAKGETDVSTHDLGPVKKPVADGRGPLAIAGAALALLLAVGGGLAIYALTGKPRDPDGGAKAGPPLPQPPPVPPGPSEFGPAPKLPPKDVRPKLPAPPELQQRPGLAEFLTSAEWEWGAPKLVEGGVNTADRELSATLSNDELVIAFTRGDPRGGTPERLFLCRRDRIGDPFGPAEPLPDAIQDRFRTSASLSGDGLLLVYATQGDATAAAWSSRRGTRDEPFGKPTKLPPPVNVPNAHTVAPALSADGRTLLVTPSRPAGVAGTNDIVMYTREDPNAVFGGETILPQPVNSSDYDTGCWVSDDRRTLVRTRAAGNVRETRFHVRATADGTFGEPQKFDIPGVPDNMEIGRPWLSPDGMRLYFHLKDMAGGAGGIDVWVAERKRKK